MDLVFRGSAGHPLAKTSSGALQLGKWWWVPVNSTSYYGQGFASAASYSTDLMNTALTGAKALGAWTTSTTTQFDSFAGHKISEDQPFYDPVYIYAEGHATVSLVSFTIPAALQARPAFKKVFIETFGGGSTLLEWGFSGTPPNYNDISYFPDYADVWNSGALANGFRFTTSKPAYPTSVNYTPHTSITYKALTDWSTGVGASIVYDTSGIWTVFNDGYYDTSTPAAVSTLLTGASTVWLASYPNATIGFNPISGYSGVLHLQNVRTGTIVGIWIYA